MLKMNELRLKNESLKATEVAQKADLKRKGHIIIATKWLWRITAKYLTF